MLVCPNVNDPKFKKDVEEFGETAAYIRFRIEQEGDLASPEESSDGIEIMKRIRDKVKGDPTYYRNAYKKFLTKAIGSENFTDYEMMMAFAARALGIGGKLEGDMLKTADRSSLLFPEAEITYARAVPVPNRFRRVLKNLEQQFNMPFTTIDDPNDKRAGFYVFDGEKRMAVVNLAYADSTTPFHEYYHPFVALLHKENAGLFGDIEEQARKQSGDFKTPAEEVVTDFLAKAAVRKQSRGLLYRFFDVLSNFFRQVFKKRVTLSEATSMRDLMDMLDGTVDVSAEVMLNKANQDAFDAFKAALARMAGQGASYADGVAYLQKLQDEQRENGWNTDSNSNFYRDKHGNDVAKRLSPFIGDREMGEFSVREKDKIYTWPEYIARQQFKAAGMDTKDKTRAEVNDWVASVRDDDGTLLQVKFSDLVDALTASDSRFRLQGTVIHEYIRYLIEEDEGLKAIAKLNVETKLKELQEKDENWRSIVTDIDEHPILSEYKRNMEHIARTAKINVRIKTDPVLAFTRSDKVVPELTVISDNVTDRQGNKIGTTIDNFVVHDNGDVTLIDWKTGAITKDFQNPTYMLYGADYNVTDTRLNRAYLELAFRALILKDKFPDMRFRGMRIVKLDLKGNAVAYEVPLQNMLSTISEFYQKNDAAKFKELNDKGLFDSNNYTGLSSEAVSTLQANYDLENMTNEQQIQYIQAELNSLSYGKTEQSLKTDQGLRQRIALLTNVLIELKREAGIDVNAQVEDIPNVTGMFKNMSDVEHPKVQVFHKVLLDAKSQINQDLMKDTKEFDELNKELLKDTKALPSHVWDKVFITAFAAGAVTLSPWLAGAALVGSWIRRKMNKTTRDIYGFMWEKSNRPGDEGYYLKESNEGLTPAQIKFKEFVVRRMREKYKEVMSEVIGRDARNRPLTRAYLMKVPDELPPNFMPRVPKDLVEIKEENKWWTVGQNFQRVARHYATVYFAQKFEGQNLESNDIPVKYLFREDSAIIQEQMHSFDMERIFKLWMTTLTFKQRMDPVYGLALGLKTSLAEEFDENGNQRYPNLTNWFEHEIYGQILHKSVPSRFTTKKPTYTVGKIGAKVLGLTEGEVIPVDQERIVRAVKASVAYMAMSFKLVSATRNAVLIALLN